MFLLYGVKFMCYTELDPKILHVIKEENVT